MERRDKDEWPISSRSESTDSSSSVQAATKGERETLVNTLNGIIFDFLFTEPVRTEEGEHCTRRSIRWIDRTRSVVFFVAYFLLMNCLVDDKSR